MNFKIHILGGQKAKQKVFRGGDVKNKEKKPSGIFHLIYLHLFKTKKDLDKE